MATIIPDQTMVPLAISSHVPCDAILRERGCSPSHRGSVAITSLKKPLNDLRHKRARDSDDATEVCAKTIWSRKRVKYTEIDHHDANNKLFNFDSSIIRTSKRKSIAETTKLDSLQCKRQKLNGDSPTTETSVGGSEQRANDSGEVNKSIIASSDKAEGDGIPKESGNQENQEQGSNNLKLAKESTATNEKPSHSYVVHVVITSKFLDPNNPGHIIENVEESYLPDSGGVNAEEYLVVTEANNDAADWLSHRICPKDQNVENNDKYDALRAEIEMLQAYANSENITFQHDIGVKRGSYLPPYGIVTRQWLRTTPYWLLQQGAIQCKIRVSVKTSAEAEQNSKRFRKRYVELLQTFRDEIARVENEIHVGGLHGQATRATAIELYKQARKQRIMNWQPRPTIVQGSLIHELGEQLAMKEAKLEAIKTYGSFQEVLLGEAENLEIDPDSKQVVELTKAELDELLKYKNCMKRLDPDHKMIFNSYSEVCDQRRVLIDHTAKLKKVVFSYAKEKHDLKASNGQWKSRAKHAEGRAKYAEGIAKRAEGRAIRAEGRAMRAESGRLRAQEKLTMGRVHRGRNRVFKPAMSSNTFRAPSPGSSSDENEERNENYESKNLFAIPRFPGSFPVEEEYADPEANDPRAGDAPCSSL